MTDTTPLEEILPDNGTKQEQPTETVAESASSEPSESSQATVPKAALDEARSKVRRYTDEVGSMREELRRANDRAERMERAWAQTQQQRQQQPPPDWYENPEGATVHAVRRHFGADFQRLQAQQQQYEQMLHANARIIAEGRYSEEEVGEAEQAFMDAIQSRSLEPADYQKLVNSPNRYSAAVQWYRRQKAQREIGDDPAAFKERVRQEIMAELESGQGGNSGKAPVMPSNFASARNVGSRSGPTWGGPKPLSDIFKT